jgi:hypothetical protein
MRCMQWLRAARIAAGFRTAAAAAGAVPALPAPSLPSWTAPTMRLDTNTMIIVAFCATQISAHRLLQSGSPAPPPGGGPSPPLHAVGYGPCNGCYNWTTTLTDFGVAPDGAALFPPGAADVAPHVFSRDILQISPAHSSNRRCRAQYSACSRDYTCVIAIHELRASVDYSCLAALGIDPTGSCFSSTATANCQANTLCAAVRTCESWQPFGATVASAEIPASVLAIGDYAFHEAALLTDVSFASTARVSAIGYRAFKGTGITSIEIPASVVTIGDEAFKLCWRLTSLTFEAGSSVSMIGEEAFYRDLLRALWVPASVVNIGKEAFFGNALRKLTFEPDSALSTIGSKAFSVQYRLEENITFPTFSARAARERAINEQLCPDASCMGHDAVKALEGPIRMPPSVTVFGEPGSPIVYDSTLTLCVKDETAAQVCPSICAWNATAAAGISWRDTTRPYVDLNLAQLLIQAAQSSCKCISYSECITCPAGTFKSGPDCLACEIPEACLGDRCASGYKGRDCSVCDGSADPPWVEFFNECAECPDNTLTYVVIMVMVVFFIAAVWFLSHPTMNMPRLATNLVSLILHAQLMTFMSALCAVYYPVRYLGC